jgi:hypothetical protein
VEELRRRAQRRCRIAGRADGADVAVGLYPEPVIRVSDRIAGELLTPVGYVDSVFPSEMTPAREGEPQEGETMNLYLANVLMA